MSDKAKGMVPNRTNELELEGERTMPSRSTERTSQTSLTKRRRKEGNDVGRLTFGGHHELGAAFILQGFATSTKTQRRHVDKNVMTSQCQDDGTANSISIVDIVSSSENVGMTYPLATGPSRPVRPLIIFRTPVQPS
jgi:hypothetical protein